MNRTETTKRICSLSLLLMLVPMCSSQSQWRVSGTVVNAEGSKVSHALVEALPRPTVADGGAVGDRLNPWVQSDNRGNFKLILPPGRYRIRAKDEAGGYPDPTFLLCFDPNARFPEISVGHADISGVRVMLGTQGGVIQGELRDSATREVIPHAKVTLSHEGRPEEYVDVFTDSAGRFQFTVPSKPIQVTASAPGYETAYFHNGEPLMLSRGQQRMVVMELNSQR